MSPIINSFCSLYSLTRHESILDQNLKRSLKFTGQNMWSFKSIAVCVVNLFVEEGGGGGGML